MPGLFEDPRWYGGAGGKKQKKPPAPHIPIEDPDSISSNQIGIIVDAISEGPIEGIVGGLEGVYLDETPAVTSGSPNFKFLQLEERTGTEDQTPVSLGAGVESETPVNVRLKYGTPVVREISSPGVDGVRINIGYAGLLQQDRTTGDIHGASVTIGLAVANVTDPFPAATQYGASGKARSRFTRSYWLPRPAGTGPWRIRVSRESADAADSTLQNETYVDSYTEITSTKLSYPFTAHVAIGIRADEFSQIPSRGYHVKGLKIKVPTNYTPADADGLGTGAYSGDWDGQFKIAYSNNPAWVWYDLATNERYGLGQYVRPEHVDKWALYRIGRLCDELVESGFTDVYGSPLHERRFAMNLALQTREQAYKVMADIASAFRGMVYWSSGLITFSQDVPKAPIHQFSPVNVRDGIFSYASSARTARHTVALVRWNNPENYYLPETEYVEDEAAIQRYGVRTLDATAFGCTSRGQAHRLGRWILTTERLEKETVTFQAGLEAATLRPGDIANIIDPMRGGKRFSGRLKAGSLARIELDEPVTLAPGVVYEVSVLQGGRSEIVTAADNATTLLLSAPLAADDLTRVFVHADLDDDGTFEQSVEVRGYDSPTKTLSIGDLGGAGAPTRYRIDYLLGIVTRTVTSDPITTDSLSVSPAFDVSPEAGQVWMLAEPNLSPRPYRVVSVHETERSLYEVVALQYEEAKFAEVETGIVLDEPPPDVLPPSDLTIDPPSGLSVLAEIRVGGTGPRTFLSLSWTAPSARVRVYRVRWRLNLGNWQSLPETTATEVSLPDARPGFYDFEVVAVSVLSQISRAASIGYNHDEQTPVELARVTGLELDGQGNATTFTGHDARFAWRWNEPNVSATVGEAPSGPPAWFSGFAVRIIDPATNAVLRTEPPGPDPRYVYTLEKNRDDGGPRRSIRIEVAVRDVYGRVGPYAQLTVSNPAPAALNLLRLTGGFREVWIDFEPPTDADYAGVLVWASTNESFPLDDTTLVSDGAGRPAIFDAVAGTRYYVRAAAYDAFGREPALLNVSGVQYVDTVLVGQPELANLVVDSAMIRNLVVDTANIRDLAVKTLKIAGNAVTLFETAQTTHDRTIIAHDGSGEVGQGSWVGVLTVRLATTGGPVSLSGLLYSQVVHTYPNALLPGDNPYIQIGGENIVYGQMLPKVRYRVTRTAVTPPGAPTTVFESGATSISSPGYVLAGVVSRMDSPLAGLWDYQLQVRWDSDYYELGQLYLDSNPGTFGGFGYRFAYSMGGTRWASNIYRGHGTADHLHISDGAGGWIDIGAIPPYTAGAPYVHTDTQMTVYAYQSTPPYYAGTHNYRVQRGSATQLTLDLGAASFLTGSEFRR